MQSAASRRLASHLRFVGEFVREPLTTGAVWPSSPVLARAIVEHSRVQPGDTVVELGPGTGIFTERILSQLGGRGRLVAMEINANHVTQLRRRFPRAEIVHDSAENLTRHVGRDQAACIISGLAWGNMRLRTQLRILRAIHQALRPGGQFLAFAYVHALWLPSAQRFRRRLFDDFARVETTPIVWRNLPPALIYRCWGVKPSRARRFKLNLDAAPGSLTPNRSLS